MSEYTNLISRLQTKVGPIILEEILELIENQEFSANVLFPGSVARSVVDELRDLGAPLARFGTVDPTGATDSSATVASALASGEPLITIPRGIFLVNETCQVVTPGQQIVGMGGVLRCGSAGISCLEICADNVSVRGLRLDNPGGYKGTSGYRTSGIAVSGARFVSIIGCFVDGFLNGIIVTSTGSTLDQPESYDVLILGNQVTNVIGISQQDRSGGIVSFGSRTIIAHNLVSGAADWAEAGCGLLHGIKVEGLAASRIDGLISDHGAIIVGNYVNGRFLHGIFTEQVDQTLIADNIVAPCLSNAIKINSGQSIVRGNICAHSDTRDSWSAFPPGTIYAAEGSRGVLIEGNTVYAGPYTNDSANDAAFLIDQYAASVRMVNNRIAKGFSHYQNYTLASVTGTFQAGTAGDYAVSNGQWAARLARSWNGDTSLLSVAQNQGFFKVGDTLTQTVGSGSGTVSATDPAPQKIKAGVRGSASGVIDLLIDGLEIDPDTVDTGIILPVSTRPVIKGVLIHGTIDGRGIQLNTSSVDAVIEDCRIRATGNETQASGANQPIYLDTATRPRVRDNIIDSTANTSNGIHLTGCSDADVTGNRVKDATGNGIKLLTCTGSVVDGNRVDDCDARGIDIDGGSVARWGDNKAAGTTKAYEFRSGATGDLGPTGDIGNSDVTLTEDQADGAIYCNTALTADRAVNLPATARPKARLVVSRRSSATGAFNLNVKNSGGTTLKALGSASTWAEFRWVVSSGGWYLSASGTI